MKKTNLSVLLSCILALLCPLQCAVAQSGATGSKADSSKMNTKSVTEQDEEYELMDRDQVDDSNTLAIPFDDSEVEDEEEVNRLEGKDLFKIPHAQ